MQRGDHNKRASTTTTTTDPKFSPQKYRGHTLDILGVLSEFGGLTTREISDKIGISPRVVYQYCLRGCRRGVLERREVWGWSASPLGMLVLSITTTTTTTANTKLTQSYHKANTKLTPKVKQLNLATFTSRKDITDPDRSVVAVLSDHYEKTGIVYKLFADQYEVAEVMKISVDEVIPTLRHLKEEGCIYFMREALGWKVGLKKAFVERLQHA